MGFFSTLLGFTGFGVGVSAGLTIGYFCFIYFQPNDVTVYFITLYIFLVHVPVMLLGRLHHRNLVNLVGYCAEKGQHMLIYVYMSKGSLASHLYSEKHEQMSWGLRVQIALYVARGLEYLHDGAVPPVIHRDIKSSNILLDQSKRARGTAL